MTWAPKWMWGWPSWLVELVSGLVTVGGAVLAAWACRYGIGLLIVATILSCLYEKYADVNGFDWKDIGQREVGIVAGILLWLLLR